MTRLGEAEGEGVLEGADLTREERGEQLGGLGEKAGLGGLKEKARLGGLGKAGNLDQPCDCGQCSNCQFCESCKWCQWFGCGINASCHDCRFCSDSMTVLYDCNLWLCCFTLQLTILYECTNALCHCLTV